MLVSDLGWKVMCVLEVLMSFKLTGVKIQKDIYTSQKYETLFQWFCSIKSCINRYDLLNFPGYLSHH